MNDSKIIVIGNIVAVLFWFADSAIDYLLGAAGTIELIPEEINELWMRCLIVILISGFSFYMQRAFNKLEKVQRERTELLHEKIAMQEEMIKATQESKDQLVELERTKIYKAMLSSTNHVLNNFLNQLQLFELAAQKSSDFPEETLGMFHRCVADTALQVKELGRIEEINEQEIIRSVTQ